MEIYRGTRVEINLDNLKHNVDLLLKDLGPGVTPMAIIKADAYGHGAVVMMKYMMKYGIKSFGVATMNEALELRAHYKDGEILILGLSSDRLLRYGADYNIAQCISDERQANILSEYCAKSGLTGKIWIKVDTGLHRIGFEPCEESMDKVAAICRLPGLSIEGIFTHASSKMIDVQYAKFLEFIDGCEKRGCVFPKKSITDGLSTVRCPEKRLNAVRPGCFFYGYAPDRSDVKSLMELKSEIVHLQTIKAGEGLGYGLTDAADHDRIVATLPFGYVDGVPRAYSHYKGWVVVKGVKCPIIGLECMDQTMADVTGVPDVKEGDEVLVYSTENGAMNYHKDAEIADFNHNGLQCATPPRVPRVYIENGEVAEVSDYLLDGLGY